VSGPDQILTRADEVASEATDPLPSPAEQPAARPRQRWLVSACRTEEAAALAGEAKIPPLIAELLLARGIQSATEAGQFLNPSTSSIRTRCSA
jgi:hypothetical protein